MKKSPGADQPAVGQDVLTGEANGSNVVDVSPSTVGSRKESTLIRLIFLTWKRVSPGRWEQIVV